ncbi:hypothetical protein SAMN02745174_02034 [Cetobacterium ceti]|uniref:Uncharacterized protein n=1 Tax=Cetobacterium ceti TaxID=180163 RepID=A0A1T4PTN7_9FUSO|nr:pyocin knob domain-containing protein [Cetobacterium ceti]SJZ94892.1 hypothetical protein SAMN02745174_02034 [Cetobacterium ceti]
MNTNGAIITNAGLELISHALANNKNISFTKTKLGKGNVNSFDEAKKLNDIIQFYKEIPITSIARNNSGIVRIRSSFTNADFPHEVILKEVGIFAKTDETSEILFAYVNDGLGENFPPGNSGNVIERTRDIYVGVGSTVQVNAIIDKSVVYATVYDLEEGLNKKEDKFPKNSGWNLEKTDLTENDTNKIFTALGALNLKNWLVTNYTTLMNNIRGTLETAIGTKLAHGGYGGTGQTLFNLIESAKTSLTSLINGKENSFSKNSGWNLEKTDLTENNSNKLFTAKGALNLVNNLTTTFTNAINKAKEALRVDISRKEDKFPKNSGFNLEKTDIVENDGQKLISAKGVYEFGLGKLDATKLNFIIVRESDNLNDLKGGNDDSVTLYKIPTSFGTTDKNYPSGSQAGMLLVFRTYGIHIYQKYINVGANFKTCERVFNGASWTDWISLKEEMDMKVSKAGDTMTGTLTIERTSYPSVKLNSTSQPNETFQKIIEANSSGGLDFITRNKNGSNNGFATLLPGETGNIPIEVNVSYAVYGALKVRHKKVGNTLKVWLNIGYMSDSQNGSIRLSSNTVLFDVSVLVPGYKIDRNLVEQVMYCGVARGYSGDRGYFWNDWVVNVRDSNAIYTNSPTEFSAYSRTCGYLEIPIIKA